MNKGSIWLPKSAAVSLLAVLCLIGRPVMCIADGLPLESGIAPLMNDASSVDAVSEGVAQENAPFMTVAEITQIVQAAGYDSPEEMCSRIIMPSWEDGVHDMDFQHGSEGRVYMIPGVREFCLKVDLFEEVRIAPLERLCLISIRKEMWGNWSVRSVP